jgi:hypothetical protein
MTGSKYSYAIMQLETWGVLHLDYHMFVQEDFYQYNPDVMAHIMTQLSLKSGLKHWGDKAYVAVMLETKQLHFWNTFKPKHCNKLSKTQHHEVLESHIFLQEKQDGPSGKDCGQRKQTVRQHFQARCKFANHCHRSHTVIVHH